MSLVFPSHEARLKGVWGWAPNNAYPKAKTAWFLFHSYQPPTDVLPLLLPGAGQTWKAAGEKDRKGSAPGMGTALRAYSREFTPYSRKRQRDSGKGGATVFRPTVPTTGKGTLFSRLLWLREFFLLKIVFMCRSPSRSKSPHTRFAEPWILASPGLITDCPEKPKSLSMSHV